MGTRRGGILIHALEKRFRERDIENRSRRARLPNLLNKPLVGIHLLTGIIALFLAPRTSYPCSKRPHSMCVHAKKKMEGKSVLKTSWEKMPNRGKQTCEAYERANKHVIKQKEGV